MKQFEPSKELRNFSKLCLSMINKKHPLDGLKRVNILFEDGKIIFEQVSLEYYLSIETKNNFITKDISFSLGIDFLEAVSKNKKIFFSEEEACFYLDGIVSFENKEVSISKQKEETKKIASFDMSIFQKNVSDAFCFTGNLRPVLEFVSIEKKENCAVVVGTDSFNLFCSEIKGEIEKNFLIAPNAQKFFSTFKDGRIDILENEGRYSFVLYTGEEKIELVTKKSGFKFPEWEKILPKELSKVCDIEKKKYNAFYDTLSIAQKRTDADFKGEHENVLYIKENTCFSFCDLKKEKKLFLDAKIETENNFSLNKNFLKNALSILGDSSFYLGKTDTRGDISFLSPLNDETKFVLIVNFKE